MGEVAGVTVVLASAGVVGLLMVLVTSGYIVRLTGETKGLRDLALVIAAFAKWLNIWGGRR